MIKGLEASRGFPGFASKQLLCFQAPIPKPG